MNNEALPHILDCHFWQQVGRIENEFDVDILGGFGEEYPGAYFTITGDRKGRSWSCPLTILNHISLDKVKDFLLESLRSEASAVHLENSVV